MATKTGYLVCNYSVDYTDPYHPNQWTVVGSRPMAARALEGVTLSLESRQKVREFLEDEGSSAAVYLYDKEGGLRSRSGSLLAAILPCHIDL